VRPQTDRFRAFSYDELTARDKTSVDIFWLRDETLEDPENLPAPEVIAAEIVERDAVNACHASAGTLSVAPSRSLVSRIITPSADATSTHCPPLLPL
jgi:hypothetical protein